MARIFPASTEEGSVTAFMIAAVLLTIALLGLWEAGVERSERQTAILEKALVAEQAEDGR